MSGAVAKFDLVRPCADCPFRTDCLRGWLGKPRAQEILNAITAQQGTFACHKTTIDTEYEDSDEHGDQDGRVVGPNSQHCAGALILLEKLERPNQMMRIAERIGWYDASKLDMGAPVFDTGPAFVAHHAGEYPRKRRAPKSKRTLRSSTPGR